MCAQRFVQVEVWPFTVTEDSALATSGKIAAIITAVKVNAVFLKVPDISFPRWILN